MLFKRITYDNWPKNSEDLKLPRFYVKSHTGLWDCFRSKLYLMGKLQKSDAQENINPNNLFPNKKYSNLFIRRTDIPKIPIEELYKINSFFKAIMSDIGSLEALAVIFYDTQEKVYITDIPEQEISGGSVKTSNKTPEKYQDQNRYIIACEIHSHNSMPAFFSSVDDADEKGFSVYGVIGNYPENPTIKLRAGGSILNIPIQVKDVFDIDEELDLAAHSDDPFPKEWLSRLTKKVYRNYKHTAADSDDYYVPTYFYDDWMIDDKGRITTASTRKLRSCVENLGEIVRDSISDEEKIADVMLLVDAEDIDEEQVSIIIKGLIYSGYEQLIRSVLKSTK